MFKKKASWYRRACKALFFSGLLYKIARMFMKSTVQTNIRKGRRAGEYDVVEVIRKILKECRSL